MGKGRVYILGAGPAGLALADGLAERGVPFTVIERSDQIGGLAKTVEWGHHGTHDLGPHKIFTLDPLLMKRVENLLPKHAWLSRDKKSSIYMRGHFLPYPPSPFSLAKVYGIPEFVAMVVDYGMSMLRRMVSSRETYTFEEDLENRVGGKLYRALFQPIALKLWGDPTKLDVKLSKGRIQTPKLSEVLLQVVGRRKKSEFEALTFLYPQGGLGELWKAIEARTKGFGTIRLNTEVVRAGTKDNRITTLNLRDVKSGLTESIELTEDDFVFSSLPLGLLPQIFGEQLSATTKEAIQNSVLLNDLLLVFLKSSATSVLDESWIFVPDPEIAFHRVSEQESFDPSMTPNGSIVCCEIMSNDKRDMSAKSDAELIELSKQGLKKMGFNVHAEDARVIRLPRSYPVFRPGFEESLSGILSALDSFSNFRTIGRQGAFNYIGTLDAMDIGYGAARWYNTAANSDKRGAVGDEWRSERHRTSHYPVLD